MTLVKNCKLDRWQLQSIKTGSEDRQREKLKATLGYFERLDLFHELEKQLLETPDEMDLSVDIDRLAQQLKEDLPDYISAKDNEKFEITELLFLPLPNADGYCINQDISGNNLDGYIICLNEGLWICSQLLGKAFVLENLQGDFAEFKSSGSVFFELAISHFLTPSGSNVNEVFFGHLPAHVDGAATAAQSSVAILILQFITLHEIGHIARGDFSLMNTYSFHIANSNKGEIEHPNTEQYWEAEYNADIFAIKSICEHSKADISRWANFITIWILFEWLTEVERKNGKFICKLHPPPFLRLEKLKTWMNINYPPASEAEQYIEATNRIINNWKESLRGL
ncbi:hypothetical protein HC024_14110 [Methylococcaceae bacterium WWC4]|nr:hypothetical protein [Methylococcaceae bacterium WWC4]